MRPWEILEKERNTIVVFIEDPKKTKLTILTGSAKIKDPKQQKAVNKPMILMVNEKNRPAKKKMFSKTLELLALSVEVKEGSTLINKEYFTLRARAFRFFVGIVKVVERSLVQCLCLLGAAIAKGVTVLGKLKAMILYGYDADTVKVKDWNPYQLIYHQTENTVLVAKAMVGI
jgi:hypothetical protein